MYAEWQFANLTWLPSRRLTTSRLTTYHATLPRQLRPASAAGTLAAMKPVVSPNVTASLGLVRALGPWMAVAVVVGTVIGSGVFKKPQSVAANVPDFTYVALVWILGGVLAFLGALALAEVSVLFPHAGGNYVFLREGYGRLASFLWGWVEFWIVRAASLAALATIFSESLHDVLKATLADSPNQPVLSYWSERLLTVAVILGLVVVNIRGVRWGGGLQLFITAVKVASLLAIIVLPFILLRPDEIGIPETNRARLPTSSLSMGGLFTALLAVIWAYHGWMNIAPVAGEVNNPNRNLPLAFLGGVGIITFLYLGANLAYHLVIPQHEMAHSQMAVATVFSVRLLGAVGGVLVSAAIMCSVFGSLNGNLLVGPRLLYAMGEDGLAPRALSAIHPRYRTPAWAIAIMGGWACLLVLAVGAWTALREGDNKSIFDKLTDFSMFGAILFETLAVTTIFVFRRNMPDAPRPYRCWGYPWVPLVYLILPALVFGNMFVNQQEEAIAGVSFIAIGAVVYFMAIRNRPRSPAALPVAESDPNS